MRIFVASMLAGFSLITGCAAKQTVPLSAASEPCRDAWVTHDEFEMQIANDTSATRDRDEEKAAAMRPALATHTKQKN